MQAKKFKLIQVHSIAVNNDILKKCGKFHSDPIEKLKRKFEENRIKTEQLRQNLIAFKLNEKARAICRFDKDCLVIEDILESHEYDRSKYLNKKTLNQKALQ